MTFLFIGPSIGCAAFLFKIASEYMHETPVWNAKVAQAEAEREQYESQAQTLIQAKETRVRWQRKWMGRLSRLSKCATN